MGRREVGAAFEALFGHAQSKVLTHAWVRAYEHRRKPPLPGRSHVAGGVEVAPPDEPPRPVPEPHEVQAEALLELEATREAGNKRGLVVLATGLGKTWLSAFDSVPSRRFSRVLFVAHREEILKQAMDTFAQIRPDATLGLYTGKQKDVDAEVMFASVMTLGRDRHLAAVRARGVRLRGHRRVPPRVCDDVPGGAAPLRAEVCAGADGDT